MMRSELVGLTLVRRSAEEGHVPGKLVAVTTYEGPDGNPIWHDEVADRWRSWASPEWSRFAPELD